jgi:hypothetical protein
MAGKTYQVSPTGPSLPGALVRGVMTIDVENGTLYLMNDKGSILAAFASGAWACLCEVEEADATAR